MEELWKFLAGTGVAGAVLVWHLWRLEPRLRAIEVALLIKSKVDLMQMAMLPRVAPELKEAQIALVKQIDEALKEPQTPLQ